MSEPHDISEIIRQRDTILMDMDTDAAKVFIEEHGGRVTGRKINWERVLHTVRFEVRGSSVVPDDAITESQIYLARNGYPPLAALPSKSPYLESALSILFPQDVFMQTMEKMNHARKI